MKEHDLDAYFVPSTDPHQSEYVPTFWQRRAYMSGFTGSAGDLLVLKEKAGLWTDGRYFLQAEQELAGSGIDLFKMGMINVPTLEEFISEELESGQRLGVDPRVLGISRSEEIEKWLNGFGAEIVLLDENLVDEVWTDQPPMPREPISVLDECYSGEGVEAKLGRIRKEMAKRKVDAHLLTQLDSVAWAFNVRGKDVNYNPVAIAYGLITPQDARLFIHPEKVSQEVRERLTPHVTAVPYEEIGNALKDLSKRKARVWVDPTNSNRWSVDLLKRCELLVEPTPIARMRSRKNETQMVGMRTAHVRDGVAMVKFLSWLEEAVPKGDVTELSAEERLEKFRSEGDHFQGLSFRTISGYGEHGAIVHYAASETSNAELKSEGIYLIDSGAQYLDGTTDITRTVLLGASASDHEKACFTRVLKGHIRLARVSFPKGVRGMRLDTLAREALWQAGLDYNHGTGHGVGSYLGVHEGPQSISPTRCIGVPLEIGNVQSNEPGYYEAGKFGIRIENLVMVEANPKFTSDGEEWYQFETLTLCPIDTKLVDTSLLDKSERKWLNEYHQRVEEMLSPLLPEKERAWLEKACQKI